MKTLSLSEKLAFAQRAAELAFDAQAAHNISSKIVSSSRTCFEEAVWAVIDSPGYDFGWGWEDAISRMIDEAEKVPQVADRLVEMLSAEAEQLKKVIVGADQVDVRSWASDLAWMTCLINDIAQANKEFPVS